MQWTFSWVIDDDQTCKILALIHIFVMALDFKKHVNKKYGLFVSFPTHPSCQQHKMSAEGGL